MGRVLKNPDLGHITGKFGVLECHILRLGLSFGKAYPRKEIRQRI